MPFRVVLDACVLLPYQLCDLLLHLAEAELYQPLWTDQILDEVQRNLPRAFERTEEQARRRVGQMRRAFPTAGVDGYENLIPAMTNDPKDRHVLAAAVRAGAACIVTFNLKDFPPAALDPFSIEAMHPDDFLLDQLDLDPRTAQQCLVTQYTSYRNPAIESAEFYDSLAVTVPMFAAEARRLDPLVGSTLVTTMPAALVIVSDNDAFTAMHPSGEPDPATPLGAVSLWLAALHDIDKYRNAARLLSFRPVDWGDYRSAATSVRGWTMTQAVHPNDDVPEEIVYVKLIPDTGHSMQAFADITIEQVKVVTLRRKGDQWRIWGISDNYWPPAARVLGSPDPGQ